jgi:hypothetical protein
VKKRIAKAHVLLGLAAFVTSSAVPTRAFADGSELVTGIAPASPPPPPPESKAEPTAPSPAPESSTPSSTQPSARVVALVLGGIAVVGAGSGIAFGVLALKDKSSFESHPTFRAADSANENAVLSDVCLGGAVVAAVTSIVLLVRSSGSPPKGTAGSHESKALRFMVSPMIASHGGGAGAALRF